MKSEHHQSNLANNINRKIRCGFSFPVKGGSFFINWITLPGTSTRSGLKGNKGGLRHKAVNNARKLIR